MTVAAWSFSINMKGARLLEVLGGALFVIVVASLLFPAITHKPRQPGRSAARNDVGILAAALKHYYVEYGRWPDFTSNGLFLDEARQTRLLAVLMAKDDVNNPRKIVFLESKTATRRWAENVYSSGLHPITGAFLDPWGQPYRIMIDHDYDYVISNPYPQDGEIRANVIVWSEGKDGKRGAPENPRTQRGSDDIPSWN